MIYCFLASGFEEIEAVAAVDTVRRGELEVKTVGIGGKVITGSHGISVVADMEESELHDISDLTGVILPGGLPGTLNLGKSEIVKHCLRYANDNGKLLAAICAAPSVLGQEGYLEGKQAVCYDGFEELLMGATIGEGRTCVSENVITAIGAGAAIEFGVEIIRYFKGSEQAEAVRKSMKCKE